VTKQLELLALVGCVLLASCSSAVPVDDAGQPPADSGTPADGGESDAGPDDGGTSSDAGPGDGGEPDGGMDASVPDAGCVGTAAAQLAFVSAPQTLEARACSAALKVQLQTGCGVPVNTAANLPVAFAASSATTEFFGDGACIGKPAVFVIPGGANTLDIFFRDTASGTSTVTASATGLDAGSQLQTFSCPAGEKPCNGTTCIPNANCCTTADCTAPKICNAAGACRVPPCSGFVNGCTTFVPYDGGTIVLGSPFNPKCARTSTSASVRFSGTFHTLEQTCGPRDVTVSSFGSTYTASGFSSFGTYGFHCGAHPTSTFEVGAIQTP